MRVEACSTSPVNEIVGGRQKQWKVTKSQENDPLTYVYYLKPPGGYSLEVIVGLNEIAEQEKVSVETFGDPFSFSYRVDVRATADGKAGMQIPSKFFIGRAFQQLACIPAEASRWFSRHHCCIIWSYEDLRLGEASFFINDLKSANGTFLNGRRIVTNSKPSPLADGDVIGVSMTEKGELMLGFRFRVPHLSSYVRGIQPSCWSGLDSVSPKIEAPLLLKPCQCLACRSTVWSKESPTLSQLLLPETHIFDSEHEILTSRADDSVVGHAQPVVSLRVAGRRGLSLPSRPVYQPTVPMRLSRRFSLPSELPDHSVGDGCLKRVWREEESRIILRRGSEGAPKRLDEKENDAISSCDDANQYPVMGRSRTASPEMFKQTESIEPELPDNDEISLNDARSEGASRR